MLTSNSSLHSRSSIQAFRDMTAAAEAALCVSGCYDQALENELSIADIHGCKHPLLSTELEQTRLYTMIWLCDQCGAVSKGSEKAKPNCAICKRRMASRAWVMHLELWLEVCCYHVLWAKSYFADIHRISRRKGLPRTVCSVVAFGISFSMQLMAANLPSMDATSSLKRGWLPSVFMVMASK